jgi:hypothetical protein
MYTGSGGICGGYHIKIKIYYRFRGGMRGISDFIYNHIYRFIGRYAGDIGFTTISTDKSYICIPSSNLEPLLLL